MFQSIDENYSSSISTPISYTSFVDLLFSGKELAKFTVMYAKASTKKHKTWEGDGILICYADYAVMKSEDEKEVLGR